MILVIIAISTILFFMSFVLIKKNSYRFITAGLFLIILMVSVAALVANDKNHFGMEQKTTSKTISIKPMVANSQMPLKIVLYQPVGTSGKDNVYLYKTTNNKKTNTQTDGKTSNKVLLTTTKEARLTVKTTKYVYKNNLTKWLFKLDKKQQIVRRENKFILPKTNWVQLSVAQAKKLQVAATKAQTKTAQARQKQAAMAFVSQKLKGAMTKKPALMTDKQAQQALTQKYLAEYKMMVARQLIEKIKK
ncbi:DUF4811 domain-containing protein [Periweissella beninensis]|uniref:DUF4811 domain-containing protein n=1 Tax=Periweissella beninensis TaxID=504936 RepID=A0ABT0VJ44_9LACO|nr:DUF4811 domain-containing protein [Periweissella beninensis]MBM7543934.1 hypothetical protein [Periweissella beninensis]MCM2437660.1 DUF4811 domain-containing protein [Periweissella beninensis]MCT4396146.1 DUF4811 domain-containing protein [Periweissella beninensis]